MRPFALFFPLLVAVGCGRGAATQEQCTAMLDHYIDMVIEGDPALVNLADAQKQAVREMKRAVKKGEPSYRRVHDQCAREVKKREYDCAMAAMNSNEWEACID